VAQDQDLCGLPCFLASGEVLRRRQRLRRHHALRRALTRRPRRCLRTMGRHRQTPLIKLPATATRSRHCRTAPMHHRRVLPVHRAQSTRIARPAADPAGPALDWGSRVSSAHASLPGIAVIDGPVDDDFRPQGRAVLHWRKRHMRRSHAKARNDDNDPCAAREWKTRSWRAARARLLADCVLDRRAMGALKDTAVAVDTRGRPFPPGPERVADEPSRTEPGEPGGAYVWCCDLTTAGSPTMSPAPDGSRRPPV